MLSSTNSFGGTGGGRCVVGGSGSDLLSSSTIVGSTTSFGGTGGGRSILGSLGGNGGRMGFWGTVTGGSGPFSGKGGAPTGGLGGRGGAVLSIVISEKFSLLILVKLSENELMTDPDTCFGFGEDPMSEDLLNVQ